MATPALQPEPLVRESGFPAPSTSASGPVHGISTHIQRINFTDKILLTATQSSHAPAHWVHVPLATGSPGINPSIQNESLLPRSHLTATTVLGGTKAEDEVVGQTLATTVASALLMRNAGEERLLVLGLGLETAAANLRARAGFDELVGLVLTVL